jgi:hypothetical protein
MKRVIIHRHIAKDSALTRERLLQRIAALQQSNPDIGYHHRDFIYRDPPVFQSYSNSNLRSWLNASESLKHMYKKRESTTINN